ERVDRGRVGHVAHHRQRPDTEGADLVGDRLDVAPARRLLVVRVALHRAPGAREHHVAPGPGELDRDRAPDRSHAPGARDDRDLPLEASQRRVAHRAPRMDGGSLVNIAATSAAFPGGHVLSKFDDYPIHQTSQPIAVPATGDRNAYDRYWFN